MRSNTLPAMPAARSSGLTSWSMKGMPAAMSWASLILNSRKPLQPSAPQKRAMVGSLTPARSAMSAIDRVMTSPGWASTQSASFRSEGRSPSRTAMILASIGLFPRSVRPTL